MKLLIAALLAVFSTGAIAGWTLLGNSDDKSYDVYIDKTAIHKKGNVAKAWILFDYKQPQDLEPADPKEIAKPYSSLRTLYEHDCAEIRYRPLVKEFFSYNMGKGGSIEWKAKWFEAHKNNGDWEDPAPDSIGMGILKLVCKK